MGRIIAKRIRGMNWMAKVSLVLIFTMVFSTFMYQGWYKPKQAEAATTTYDFSTGAGTNKFAYHDNNNYRPTAGQPPANDTTLPTTGLVFTATDYTAIGAEAGTTFSDTDSFGDANAIQMNINISETPADISSLVVTYSGIVELAMNLQVFIWNYTTTSWQIFDNVMAFPANTDVIRTATYDRTGLGFADFVSGGQVKIVIQDETISRPIWTVDYLKVDVNYVSDTTPPVEGTLSVSPESGTYVPGTFTITEGFTDAESAITGCEYSIVTPGPTWVAATWNSGPGTCTATPPAQADGTALTIKMRATSGGGTSTPVNSLSRTVDAAAPTTTDDYPGGTVTSDPTITMTPNDGTGSGVASTQYCVDQTNSCSPATVGTSTTITGTPGALSTWYLRYFSTDNLGNVEGTVSTTVTIDHTCIATAPTGLAAGTVTTTSVDLTWSAGANTDSYKIYRDSVEIATGVTGTLFTDSGRNPSVTYAYYVKGHNDANNCDSGASTTLNKSTLAVAPGAPTVVNVSSTSLNVTIGTDSNSTEATYAIRANNDNNLYVQAGNTLGVTPDWRTKAVWGTTTVTGLSAIPYTFDVKARNGNGELLETGFGSDSSPAVTPHDMLPTTINSCAGCHGYGAITDGTPRNTPAGTFQGSHNKHVVTYSKVCSVCHTTPATETSVNYGHRNGNIQMDSGKVTYGTGASWAQTNSPSFAACSNTYCHSIGIGGTSETDDTRTVQANTSPTWGDNTATCSTCHQAPPNYPNNDAGYQNKRNSHGSHTTQCQTCHNATTTDGTSIANTTLHANKYYNINQGNGVTISSYTYAIGGGTCNTISCHVGANAQWGVTAVGGCIGCHNQVITRTKAAGTLANVVAEMQTAAGWTHALNNGRVATNAMCIVCHLEGDSATQKTSAKHADGNIDLRDPDGGTTEAAITRVSDGGTFTFQKFATDYSAGTRYTDGHLRDDIDNVLTQKFCLKCHDSDGATNPGARVSGGTQYKPFNTTIAGAGYVTPFSAGVAGGVVDVDRSFTTTNSSVHPVKGPRYKDFPTQARFVTGTPYTNFTRAGTSGSKANGVVLNCFDCHNQPTELTNRTVVAHGSSTAANAFRGTIYAASPTLCSSCHVTLYAQNDMHGAGSAWNSANGEHASSDQQNCHDCHGQASIKPARPQPAEDYHGFNRLPGTGADALWPVGATESYRPYGFIRNLTYWGTDAYHRPFRGTEAALQSGGAQCSATNQCDNGRNMGAVYTPGGSY